MEHASPQDLQNYLDYTSSDPAVLDQALTRRAYLNDRQLKNSKDMTPLATLGDAVLNVIVVDHFFKEGGQTKGKLTDSKICHVKRKQTRAFAERHSLQRFVLWGKTEIQKEQWKHDKALDTVTEALIGAIYLDAQNRGMNGMTVVRDILEKKNFFQEVP